VAKGSDKLGPDEMDFEGDADDNLSNVDGKKIKTIADLAQKQIELDEKVVHGQAFVADLQAELKQVKEVDLPAAMAAAGVDQIKLSTGEKVTVEHLVRANIPKKHQGAAMAWLRKHKAGSLIKNEVVAKFGAKEDKKAAALAKQLLKEKVEHARKESVPWNTLSAYVREQMEAGRDIPKNIFGIYTFDQAKIES